MKISFLLIALISFQVLAAQDFTEGVRLELPSTPRLNAWRLVVLPNSEYMVYEAEAEKIFGRQRKWFFRKYNQNFELDWQTDWTSQPKLFFLGNAYDQKQFFGLFGALKAEEYQLLGIDTQTGKQQEYNFFTIKKLVVDSFEVIDSVCFLAGSVKNTPLVLRIDLKTKKSRVLPTSLDEDFELLALEKDKENKLIYVASVQEKNKQTRLFIKSFEKDGSLHNAAELLPEEGINLLSTKINFVGKDEFLVVGTYAKNNLQTAEGIYIAKFKDRQQVFLNYYAFTDLRNFYSYLPENQQDKMKEKKEKKEAKGKEFTIRYRLLVHDLRKFDDQYLFVAEAYYPVYRSEDQMNWAMNRRWAMPQSSRVFDGFVYTHALMLTFDANGKILFDQTSEIKNVKLQNLQKLVSTQLVADSLSLLYSNNGKIYTSMYKKDQLLEKKELKIRPLNSDEILRFSTENRVGFWSKNRFLAWGYQSVRSPEKRRHVFYVNQIKLD